MIKFKQYENRKYYNLETSSYSDLYEIESAARKGPIEVLKCLPEEKPVDITASVLKRIIANNKAASLSSMTAKDLQQAMQQGVL